ncbi:hypothetical protein SOVF_192270, partial [Spinacia oleracea]
GEKDGGIPSLGVGASAAFGVNGFDSGGAIISASICGEKDGGSDSDSNSDMGGDDCDGVDVANGDADDGGDAGVNDGDGRGENLIRW